MDKKKSILILAVTLLLILCGVTGLFLYLHRDNINHARKLDFSVLQDADIGKVLDGTTRYRFAPESAFSDDYEGTWLVETFYEGNLVASDFDPYLTDNVFQVSQHKVSKMSLVDETCGEDALTESCMTIGKNVEGRDIVKLGYADNGQAWYGTDLSGTRVNIWTDSSETATNNEVLAIYKNMAPVNKYLLGFNQKQYF